MSMAKTKAVTETQGNVFFCNFGAHCARPENNDNDLGAVLTAVKNAVAQIDADSKEIRGANVALAQLGADNSNLLFVTLGKIDNIAFHSNILSVDGAQREGDATGISPVAHDVRRFVTRGAAVTTHVLALVTRHKDMLMAAGGVLREISEQVAELEAMTCARTDPVRARLREVELTNFCNYETGVEP